MSSQERTEDRSVVHLEPSGKKALSPELLAREVFRMQEHLRDLERELLDERQKREQLESKFESMERALQVLSTRYLARHQETEGAVLAVAVSLREQFDEYHRFKRDVQGLAAHVDRWTKRAESLKHLTPVKWVRRLRKR